MAVLWLLWVLQTISNPKINDFEESLEYYAAFDASCNIIITEDTTDFWFSDIKVLNCAGFINQLIFQISSAKAFNADRHDC